MRSRLRFAAPMRSHDGNEAIGIVFNPGSPRRRFGRDKLKPEESRMSDEKVTVVKSGGGTGVALLAIAFIALLVVLFLLFGQGLLKQNDPIKADVKIETPSKP